mmetsp:Transcript_46564/g.92591  ORF Transcript_46564/g.92591 Transcript_46564/m.92591 type:complete len:489 (-) Transcript_46564:77-1543(-)
MAAPSAPVNGVLGGTSVTEMTTPSRASGEPPSNTRSALSRRFGPLTVNGIRHSILTLCSTALGGGVLTISYVMRIVGFGLGTTLLVLGAGLAFASTKVLMRICQETGHDSYAGLFGHCAGRRGGVILDAMLVVYGNGACVGYMVFLADFVPDLINLIDPHAPAWLSGRSFAVLVTALLILPLVTQRDLAALRFFTPVSIMALAYMASTVATKSFLPGTSHDSPARGSIRIAIPSINVPEAFSICLFAFNCHMNVVPVAGSMVRATKARIIKVSAMVNLVQLTFYLLIGITGYLTFLGTTPQDIMTGYRPDDIAVAVGRFMLTGTMLVAIPTNAIPTVRSGIQLIEHLCPHMLGEDPRLLAEASDNGHVPTEADGNCETEGTTGPTPTASLRPRARLVRVVLSVSFLLIQAIVAIKVPGVADVIGLLGATIASAMILAIPAYCMGQIQRMSPKKRLLQATFYGFSLLALASVPIKLLGWCKVIDTSIPS